MISKFPQPSRYHLFGVVRLPEGLLCYQLFLSVEHAELSAHKWVSAGLIEHYQVVSLCTDIQKIILEG